MGTSSRCAACKYLRKRCPLDCIFSPYFPSHNPRRFAFVHRVYGASNVARMLQRTPAELREQAANALCFEAKCRIEDPVYGCVKIIHNLHHQINEAHNQLIKIQAQIALIDNSYGPDQAHLETEIGPVFSYSHFDTQNWYDQLGPFQTPAFSVQDFGLK